MAKREILIKKLIEHKAKMLTRLSNDELFVLADDLLCDECPLNGLCERYLASTCEESIKKWFYEGGSNDNNN